MTNYPQIQESLNRLSELLTLIEGKEAEIPTAKKFNEGCVILLSYIDAAELRKELKALKEEYRDLTRKINLK